MHSEWVRRQRRRVAVMSTVVLCAVGLAAISAPAAQAADPCTSGNAVACENSKAGNPASEWDIVGSGDDAIQGFATTMSVQPGSTVQFKIKAQTAYSVDVYRLGYYGGLGAHRQAATWSVSNPVQQPACASDSFTQNYDCGTWAVSTQWTVPSTAVSGVYVAKLTMGTNNSHITFVVRDDASTSDVVFKTSDSTWQAYNVYGGADFYTAPSAKTQTQPFAFKISYNRPIATRGSQEGRDSLFSNECPTLRFLERNGVDVSYTTDVDVSVGATKLANHRAFLSVGHDEYWTLPERDAVTAARDAGVNMMFLSGNEAYWHTRLEPSIDGTATPNRTLVCYKDSWEGSKLDPSPEGTPTWRDPAYGAPAGSSPENSLTGTLYMSNNTDLAITVSATQGKSRLWRGTSLASLPAGASAALAPHTVGYESDEDLDNRSRPAGLMTLSTTTGATAQYVQNPAGTTVAPGTTTHNLTLYRAVSGALVFGAGTVQWGLGLDQTHDGDNSNPADSRMQQATLNMLADMGVQPTTLMSGLVQPAKTTDTTPPTVVVTGPASGASLQNGAQVRMTGTASDAGVVTTVEVSLDGGSTYHRAAGTTSWTYTGVLSGVGASSIRVRASDDSANLSAPTSLPVTISCPCSIFGAATPKTPSTADASAVELGVAFVPDADGFVSAVRFYKGSTNAGTHIGTLWTSSGQALASGTFANETATGWQTVTFGSAVPVTAGARYVASYWAPSGHYAADANVFTSGDVRASPLTAPGRPSGVANGVYATSRGFPTQTYGDTDYYVDVLYSRDDTTPPAVSTQSPLPGSTSVARAAQPTATFAGTVDPASVAMTLKDANGAPVPGNVAFDAASRTVGFTPGSPMAYGAKFTASVTASSATGVPMAAPYTWSFTISTSDPVPGACPCSIWPDSATPVTASVADTGSVELGVKFTAEVDGQVQAIRFYKGPQNVGTHTGSVWSAEGVLLGSVTCTGESTSGWQTAYFTNPVNVAAGRTYIASYRAPNGGYAVTANGLAAAVDSPPLHTVAGGAVYTYGNGAPLTTSSANYWVDLVFLATDAAPTVSATTLGASASNVNRGAKPAATFSGQIMSGSAQLGLRDASGQAVAGTTAYVASTRTITFSPAQPLAPGVVYTGTVNGAAALSGNLMSPFTWSFTTAGSTACPCSLFESTAVPAAPDAGDASGVELGVSFTPAVDGYVTSVRFYKSAQNVGTHSGSLWSGGGMRLATGTFTNETAGGWQTLTFASPVQLAAGTRYVASYFAPSGHYAAASQFFTTGWTNGPLSATGANGLYRYGSASGFPTDTCGSANYWVDLAFTPGSLPDTAAPTVTGTSPLGGSTSQPWNGSLTATFSEAITPASLVMGLKAADGSAVPGSAAYDAATRTATFTAGGPLARGAVFTGSASATDTAGNAMSAPGTWTFTTAQPDPAPGVCPCSIWTDATTPAVISDSDARSVELGTAFTTDTSGSITGVRFYKGPFNTGTHTASLWATDGTRLATVTVAGESTTGSQTATFGSPVTVTAGTTYVVSYMAPNGRFSATVDALTGPVDTPPLHAIARGGRYLYGGGFPSSTSTAGYGVDPVFVPASGPPDTTAPAVTNVTVLTSGSTATVTWTTDEPATSAVAYGTSPTLGLNATGPAGTLHSVTLSGLTSGATYSYRVTSTDPAGNATTSPAQSVPVATLTAPDTVAPVVTNVAVATSGSSATVTWSTDETSSTSVAYGTSAALGQTVTGPVGTSHSVTLTGLTSGASYSYRVTSADAAGNTTTSPVASSPAATFAAADTVAPVVSAVAVATSGSTATVTWTTDESASSSIAYGTSSALGQTATGAPGMSHSVTVAGLTSGATYSYRVTSVDSAGNATTAPATSAAPATFVAPDTVAPTISGLAASGSGTAANVTWSTDESASSVVQYGTSAASLTLTATGAADRTHTVALAGLTANTRYYYRVTSADAAGNTSTSPAATAPAAQYTPTVQPFTWTTVADFSTGTGAYVADTSGGEVMSAPTLGAEFTSGATGGAVPSTLTSTALVSGGTTTVANNVSTISGARVASVATYGSGNTMEVGAQLAPNSSVGLASTATGSTGVQAAFSLDAAGALTVSVNDGGAVHTTIPVSGTFNGTVHRYRVDYANLSATFFVDGAQVASSAFLPVVPVRAVASDSVRDTSALVVDWLRAGTYAAKSTYVSAVIDAGAVVGWDTLTRDVATAPGTTVNIQVRSGPNANPGRGPGRRG